MTTKKKKRGAPKGSRNAAKEGGPVTTQIVFRCPPELKAAAEKVAAPGSLSAWMVTAVEEKLSRP